MSSVDWSELLILQNLNTKVNYSNFRDPDSGVSLQSE